VPLDGTDDEDRATELPGTMPDPEEQAELAEQRDSLIARRAARLRLIRTARANLAMIDLDSPVLAVRRRTPDLAGLRSLLAPTVLGFLATLGQRLDWDRRRPPDEIAQEVRRQLRLAYLTTSDGDVDKFVSRQAPEALYACATVVSFLAAEPGADRASSQAAADLRRLLLDLNGAIVLALLQRIAWRITLPKNEVGHASFLASCSWMEETIDWLAQEDDPAVVLALLDAALAHVHAPVSQKDPRSPVQVAADLRDAGDAKAEDADRFLTLVHQIEDHARGCRDAEGTSA
jgi:hypothetical protein